MIKDEAVVSLLIINLSIPGCKSLKEKRAILAPLLNWLHKGNNLSVAEVGQQDAHASAIIGCALLSNDGHFNQSSLAKVVNEIGGKFPDIEVLETKIEVR